MSIEDKTFLLGILQLPRLKLSQQQLSGIEAIIDGRQMGLPCVAVTYRDAARMLGYSSKNSEKTMMKFVREGRLHRACPGRVTYDSVINFKAGGEA